MRDLKLAYSMYGTGLLNNTTCNIKYIMDISWYSIYLPIISKVLWSKTEIDEFHYICLDRKWKAFLWFPSCHKTLSESNWNLSSAHTDFNIMSLKIYKNKF